MKKKINVKEFKDMVKKRLFERKLSKVEVWAWSKAFRKIIKKLNLPDIPYKVLKKLLNGRASRISESHLITIGTAIKFLGRMNPNLKREANLDILLFVKECKEGIYDR